MSNYIKSINIRNYRGIDEMEINNLEKFNIFVGDNSSCKTTVMEAIYSARPFIQEGLITTANSRGMQVTSNNIYSFFYNADTKNDIEFVLNEKITTRISSKEKGNIENERIIDNLGNRAIDLMNSGEKFLYNILKTENNKETMNLNVMIDNLFQITSKGYNKNMDIGDSIWITPLNKYLNETAQIIKKLLENKKKKELLEFVNILEPDVDDIISDGFQISLSKSDVEKMLPLSSFGNGLSSIISIMGSIVMENAKTIFIDEIEDGIHYLNYPKFCEILIRIAKMKDIQLFMTTHSREFLESFYNELKDKEEKVALYRFQRANNKIKKVFYSREKAEYAINEGWDMR